MERGWAQHSSEVMAHVEEEGGRDKLEPKLSRSCSRSRELSLGKGGGCVA